MPTGSGPPREPTRGNVIFGDSGLIDFVAAEHGYAIAGARRRRHAADIDRIVSLAPAIGGADRSRPAAAPT